MFLFNLCDFLLMQIFLANPLKYPGKITATGNHFFYHCQNLQDRFCRRLVECQKKVSMTPSFEIKKSQLECTKWYPENLPSHFFEMKKTKIQNFTKLRCELFFFRKKKQRASNTWCPKNEGPKASREAIQTTV